MTTFTNEQMQNLMVQAEEIMNQVAEGKSAREIMAELYVSNLEDKSLRQGEVMADAMLDSIKAFDQNYKEAQEDIDGFLKKMQKQMDKDKNCAERCTYWLKMAAAIAAADALMNDTSLNREEKLKEIEAMNVSEEEATEELEKELREKAREALKNNSIMMQSLLQQKDALEAMDNADQAAGMLMDLGSRELEYRGIIAMLAYTGIKTGQYENIPVDMTAAQVATMVCAGVEQNRIMEAVGKGEMAMDIAASLLGFLGAVLIITITIDIGLFGIVTALEVFHLIFAIPAVLMIGSGLLYLANKGIDTWIATSKKMIRKTVAIVKTVVKGLMTVVNYIADTVIPKVIEKAKAIWESLRGRAKEEKEQNTESELVEA